MKILTILGTRPEIIRLSRIIPLLQKHGDHVLVNTGQNYDYNLSGQFLAELGYEPGPKYDLEARGSLGEQLGAIFRGLEEVLDKEKPDRFLVLGDTNSSLGAIIARRKGVPVFHLEAGNRCHDPASPEEINRKLIDHCADVHLCYTERARQNLVAEGIPLQRTFVVGNPIKEVIDYFSRQANFTRAVNKLGMTNYPGGLFFLATFHREENVDHPQRLRGIIEGLTACQTQFGCPILVSTHPRTQLRLTGLCGSQWPREITFLEPLGFLDFLALEQQARLIFTDSGTIQEEAIILGKPCITLRDSTERPETIERGGNILAGTNSERILASAKQMLENKNTINVPEEYLRLNVSQIITNILLGHQL